VDVYSGRDHIIESILEAAEGCFQEAGGVICRKIAGIGLSVSGPLCQCGNRGCLEVIAGGHAIAAAAIRVLNSGGQTLIREIVKGKINRVTTEIVAKAAALGDSIARDLIVEAALVFEKILEKKQLMLTDLPVFSNR